MRTIIEVQCTDQVLEAVTEPIVASGGMHETFVVFSFCSLWDGLEKTAVFYKEGKKVDPYFVMLDSSNMCEVPHEVRRE